MYTGISCFGRGVCMLCICKILIQRATHVKVLIQRMTWGKIADTSETDPHNLHMGSPCTHNEIVRIWGLTYIFRFRSYLVTDVGRVLDAKGGFMIFFEA
jgi:hypothetical protein